MKHDQSQTQRAASKLPAIVEITGCVQVNQTGRPRRAFSAFNTTDASPVSVQCRLSGNASNGNFVGVVTLGDWEACSSPKVGLEILNTRNLPPQRVGQASTVHCAYWLPSLYSIFNPSAKFEQRKRSCERALMSRQCSALKS